MKREGSGRQRKIGHGHALMLRRVQSGYLKGPLSGILAAHKEVKL